VDIGLVEAATDKRLLGAEIALWPKQRELLASLDGTSERTHIWSVGRQSGKSTLAAMVAIWNATCRPDLDQVLPRRRRRYILVAAPGLDQSREFIDLCRGLIQDSPVLAPLASFQADQVDFTLENGRRSCIRAMPANARTVRGRSASLVVADEFGWFSETAGPGSDEKMYKALRPSMRRFGHAARMLLISTPSGESGKFYEMFRDAESGVLPFANAVQLPVWEVDPSYDEAQREQDRAELGEDGFAAECGADFVAGGSTYLDLRGIPMDVAPVPPSGGKNWVCGLDPSSSMDQFGVALVGESVSEPGVLVVGQVAGLKPGRIGAASNDTFEAQRARQDSLMGQVLGLIHEYNPRCVSDNHMGGPVRTFLGRHGLNVRLDTPTSTLAVQRFVSVKSRIEDGSLRLWSHAQLVQDLRRVRMQDAKIVLPRARGSHCDAAVALSAAVWEHRGTTGRGGDFRPLMIKNTIMSDSRSSEEWVEGRGKSGRPAPSGEPAAGAGDGYTARQLRRPDWRRGGGGWRNQQF